MKFIKWYQARLLFMEKKRARTFGLRSYILFKEGNMRDAIRKANKIGNLMPYPYKLSNYIKFKFLGVESLFQCYSPPKDRAMLSVFKDDGNSWEDAVLRIRPFYQYEINTFQFSPIDLYLANLVYFVKADKFFKNGKVTTCQVLFKSTERKLFNKVYQIATDNKILRDVIRIRRDCKKGYVSEFVGIEEIIPVFDSIKDGMELNRTVEEFRKGKGVVPKKGQSDRQFE